MYIVLYIHFTVFTLYCIVSRTVYLRGEIIRLREYPEEINITYVYTDLIGPLADCDNLVHIN